jgi:phosphate transport system protein
MYSNRKEYDTELCELDSLVARMGHETAQAIAGALHALAAGDTALAHSIVEGDSEIDAAEREIEHRSLTLILRQQPVAGDLRKVSTALKMVTDIERMADHASDIAEIVLHLQLDRAAAVGVLSDIDRMGGLVLGMVRQAVGAYVQVDVEAAAAVIAQDDEADRAFARLGREIAGYIAAHPADAESALDLYMITKYLERLGDHAVNVAEWVEFLKTGMHKDQKIM